MTEPDPKPQPEATENPSLSVVASPPPTAHPEDGAAPVLVTDLASKTLAVKEGETFLYSDLEGNLDHGGDFGLGLYSHDTRYLSHFHMRVNGRDLVLLSSSAERGYMSHVDLTNPDLYEGDVLRAPQQTINVRRIRAIYGHLFERIRIKNYNPTDVTLEIQLGFGSDFADIFDVRGMTHRHSGGSHPPTVTDATIEFVHEGRDRIRRITRIRFGVEPDRIEVEDALATAVFRVHLEPYQTRLLAVSIEPVLGTEDEHAAPDFDHAVHELRRSYEEWERESTQIVTDNELFNQLLDRSLRDLRALYTRVGEGGVLAAGIPWYVTIFGRDSLIASHQLLAVNTRPAREALELLAARQGTEENDWRDEQPGKILHEVRDGELARAGIMPHSPYFGSVDSTPWFLSCTRSICGGPATSSSRAGCSRPPRPLSDGSTGTGTWTATGSSNTCAARPGGCGTRAGRTRTTRSSTPTAGSPSRRSRSRKCRGTSTSRRRGWPTSTARSGGRRTRAGWRTRPSA